MDRIVQMHLESASPLHTPIPLMFCQIPELCLRAGKSGHRMVVKSSAMKIWIVLKIWNGRNGLHEVYHFGRLKKCPHGPIYPVMSCHGFYIIIGKLTLDRVIIDLKSSNSQRKIASASWSKRKKDSCELTCHPCPIHSEAALPFGTGNLDSILDATFGAKKSSITTYGNGWALINKSRYSDIFDRLVAHDPKKSIPTSSSSIL
jgi:hypothetical protein